MNAVARFPPLPGVCVPALPANPPHAAVGGVPASRVPAAGQLMTRDPARIAGSDTAIEVASTMRSLQVAFLPFCDQDGDLQGRSSRRGCLVWPAAGASGDRRTRHGRQSSVRPAQGRRGRRSARGTPR